MYMPAATIVLPTRHEEGNIGQMLADLSLAFANDLHPVEVVVVDDSDNNLTVKAVRTAALQVQTHKFKVRCHHRDKIKREGGLSGAMAEGLSQARSDIVIYMDGDGQHPPKLAVDLLAKIESGKEIVVGSRYRKGGSNAGLDGRFRHFVSRSATAVAKGLFPRRLRGISDPMSGCFAVRKSLVDLSQLKADGFKFLFELLVKHTNLQRGEVPLRFGVRENGESKAGEGNGKKFLLQLARLRVGTIPTFINFAFGGALIALLGVLMLEGLVRSGVNPLAANAIQLLVTLALNFTYNRHVTWRGERESSLGTQSRRFFVTRGITLAISWMGFAALIGHGMHYQVANALCLAVTTALNYGSSKHLVFGSSNQKGRHGKRFLSMRTIVVLSQIALVAILIIHQFGVRGSLLAFIVAYAVFNFVTSSLEVRWRLYGRRDAEARQRMRFPAPVRADKSSVKFSLIVPAVDEPLVIGTTLRKLVAQTHPNVQIIATLVEGDFPTIEAVQKVINDHPDRVEMVVRDYKIRGKARQLNAALQYCHGDYVGVFDAEDDVAEDLLLHIEALIDESDADVVQSGVQLTNLDLPIPDGAKFAKKVWGKVRGWYCVHNDMEYAFWFSSRMFYQVDQGFVPLGGNTVFIRRSLLVKMGGWPLSLTEDCALGVKACVEYDAKVVAAYDPKLATREETPSTLKGLFGQRTRWDQGFVMELLKGEWRKLPTFSQRMMALYILGMPYIQAFNGLMLPLSFLGFFMLTAPVVMVLVMYLPFIPIFMTICLQLIGLREFGKDFGQKVRIRHYLSLLFGNYFFQLVLATAAVTAVARMVAGKNDWFKSMHSGIHRPANSTPQPVMTSPSGSMVVVPSREGSVA